MTLITVLEPLFEENFHTPTREAVKESKRQLTLKIHKEELSAES